jgi:hypothetical protein
MLDESSGSAVDVSDAIVAFAGDTLDYKKALVHFSSWHSLCPRTVCVEVIHTNKLTREPL